jgi:exosortase/archaeosortase
VIRKISHPTAIKGIAKIPMLNSEDHKNATISHVAVEPILAPTSTQTALISCMVHVDTNHNVRREISVLLLRIHVIVIPVNTAFRHLSVYFCKIMRNFGHHNFFIASSNISNQKSTNQSHASSFHRSINN